MSRTNVLSEFCHQIKRTNKSKEYVVMKAIDAIFDYLNFINPSVLKKHKSLLNDICTRYHKDNPLDFVFDKKWMEEKYKEKNGVFLQDYLGKKLAHQHKDSEAECFGISHWKSCALSKFFMGVITEWVDGSLSRCEEAMKDIDMLWCEVVDLFFERPELVSHEITSDEYTVSRIMDVCKRWRKNNPLTEPIADKFGKYWKDENGQWQKERRKRI